MINEVEKSLSQILGEKVHVLSSRNIGGGCINNASKLETNCGSFFLKWNSNGIHDMFLREMEGLEELRKAANGALVVPETFCAKEIDETPGFLVQEYLAPKYAQTEDDEQLGRGLATIHSYAAQSFGFLRDNYCGATPQNNKWKDDWTDFFALNRLSFLLNLIQHKRQLPSSEIDIYNRLISRMPELIPGESVPVIIHGDLWSGNFMVTAKGPALIDPAAYYADREMEFAIMTMFGGFSSRFYKAYEEVNPLLPDWQERNNLYQLYHVLNHYYLFGGGYRQQALSIAKRYI